MKSSFSFTLILFLANISTALFEDIFLTDVFRIIFLPWLPQTLATAEERKEILSFLTKANPNIAWSLLLMLHPEHRAIGHPTHKARWRLFNEPVFQQDVSNQNLWDMQSFVLSQLIELASTDEDRLSKLIDSIDLCKVPD